MNTHHHHHLKYVDHTYRDFSRYIEEGGKLIKHKKSTNNFPARLHKMLSESKNEDVIAWMPHGRAWKILNKERLKSEVLPNYYVCKKYESFSRQLNGWGFKRLHQSGTDLGCYYHESFLRDLPKLTCLIRRLAPNLGKSTPFAEGEPNFYRISEAYPLPPPGSSSEDKTSNTTSKNSNKAKESPATARTRMPSMDLTEALALTLAEPTPAREEALTSAESNLMPRPAVQARVVSAPVVIQTPALPPGMGYPSSNNNPSSHQSRGYYPEHNYGQQMHLLPPRNSAQYYSGQYYGGSGYEQHYPPQGQSSLYQHPQFQHQSSYYQDYARNNVAALSSLVDQNNHGYRLQQPVGQDNIIDPDLEPIPIL